MVKYYKFYLILKVSFRWISEKLDGIRAYWNGKIMISRNGKKINCPNWFIEEIPKDISFDGELWLERGSFELLNGIINSNDDFEWKRISFMVFDLPNSNETYEIRMRDLSNLNLPNHINLIDIERCKGNDHLQQCLVDIIGIGGEGLMVNKSNSFYVKSRVETLLKVKVCLIISCKIYIKVIF